MNNIVNRINNEFGFNYEKYIKNNNISNMTTIKPVLDVQSNINTNPNSNQITNNAKIETVDFESIEPKEKNVEIIEPHFVILVEV